ncbi:MAG TPA: metallopeptidase TldD-related protein [Acidimicrobiales bacterium]|nr:metallopeptidase TldD-related protein [Acidimicrobiales bacterium]
MSDRELLEVCDRVLALVGDGAEAQVSVAEGVDGLTRFANSSIHQNVGERVRSVQLQVALEGRVASAATTRTDDEALASLASSAIRAASLRPVDPQWPGMAPLAPLAPAEHWDDATDAAGPDDRAAVVRAFVAAGEGLSAAGYCATRATRVGLATTAGQRFETRATSATLDGIQRTGTADGSGRQTALSLRHLDGAAAGRRAAAKARGASEAADLEPGTYEVILERGCVANILDFLATFGFNAKAHEQGTSFVHLGERQFDESVSIWDDATDERSIGFLHDAEGTPKRHLDLVRGGVTTGLAHDRRTAARAGTESTGHATSDAYVAGPFPQNLFFGAGTRPADALIASVNRGLLVTDFWYTRILDPKTQVVTGLTRNGVFLIENGEVGRAVRNLRFTQSYVAALRPGNVVGIGDDARLVGQHHVPTVHLAAWSFTGGAAG